MGSSQWVARLAVSLAAPVANRVTNQSLSLPWRPSEFGLGRTSVKACRAGGKDQHDQPASSHVDLRLGAARLVRFYILAPW
jgi:hypothetical protein